MSESFDAPPPGFGDQPMSPTPGQQPLAGTAASFGQRLVARLIDMAIIFALVIAIVIVAAIIGFINSTLGAIVAVFGYLAAFAASVYIVVGGVALTGQSPGQRLQGVKVVTDSGQLLGWGPAAIRWLLASALNTVACGLPIGSAWMLVEKDKKTLYDLIMNHQAIVVPKGELMPIFPEGKPF